MFYRVSENEQLMISQKSIDEAVDRLVKAARPEKIFLFGSYARGETREESDLDFLVVQKKVKNRRQVMVQLQDTLRPMRIPADILVTSEATFNEWKNVVGTVFNDIKREGILCYDASEVDENVITQG